MGYCRVWAVANLLLVLHVSLARATAEVGAPRKCVDARSGGDCVRIDAVCAWCAPTTPTGSYCINATDPSAKSTSGRANECPVCSAYTDSASCGAALNSEAVACVWCSAASFFGPYCTAVGEINSNCANCTLDPVQHRCSVPVDSHGEACYLQCALDGLVLATCTSSASNCTSCNGIFDQILCVATGQCFWCASTLVATGPYCSSESDPNPMCNCSRSESLEMCGNTLTGRGQFCEWCAPSSALSGAYCVDPAAPPYWCSNYCWNFTNPTQCNAASGPVCEWCGTDQEGYFCGFYGNNLNCTVNCSSLNTAANCNAQGCTWCLEGIAQGDHCREFPHYCPACTHYTNVTECTPRCSWCNPTATVGPYCSAIDASAAEACSACSTYTNEADCVAAASYRDAACVWCNGRASAGSFCTGTAANGTVNAHCPLCTSYADDVSCGRATAGDGSPCVWCDASQSVGAYCSNSNFESCANATCAGLLNASVCAVSFDSHGPCVWCTNSAVTGAFCSSQRNATCAPCNGYVSFDTCSESRDRVGSCYWCNANSCTGAAEPNPLCTCDEAAKRETCMASYGRSRQPCLWCDRMTRCFENQTSCDEARCSGLNQDRCTGARAKCHWCADLAVGLHCHAMCPPCATYDAHECPYAHPPSIDAAGCFLCSSPSSPSSACAAMLPNRQDPSVCPPCSSYAAKDTCESSFSSYQHACKWCAVSYACVSDDSGCGDCFNFLVPGNRLKPYWLLFVTIVKDYIVLLAAVAVLPGLRRLWKRTVAVITCQKTTIADVTVYVAQNDIVNEHGVSVCTLQDCLVQKPPAGDDSEAPTDVMKEFVRSGSVWVPWSASEARFRTRGDDQLAETSRHLLNGGDDVEPHGHWCRATFVAARHALQRAAYAVTMPPNIAVLTLSVAFAVGCIVVIVVDTARAFADRRRSDSDFFGPGMFALVVGYRIVNSGLQPTACLTLWQVVRDLRRQWIQRRAHSGAHGDVAAGRVDPSLASLVRMVSAWAGPKKWAAAMQLSLLAPVWLVSLVGTAAYAWVFLGPVLFSFVVVRALRHLTWRVSRERQSPAAQLVNDSVLDDKGDAAAAALDASAPQTDIALVATQRLPELHGSRQLAAVLLVFLSERAVPVLTLATLLQTGYNYAALYVLAPGHVYATYLDVIAMEYNARSDACLVQEIQNVLGDSAASAISYVVPFA